jgi:hypothetical protein
MRRLGRVPTPSLMHVPLVLAFRVTFRVRLSTCPISPVAS